MAKSKVLSVKHVSFVDDKSGELIVGRQLWLLTPTKDPEWNGYAAEKLWFPEKHEMYDMVGGLTYGTELLIDYNRKGKPEELIVCDDVP